MQHKDHEFLITRVNYVDGTFGIEDRIIIDHHTNGLIQAEKKIKELAEKADSNICYEVWELQFSAKKEVVVSMKHPAGPEPRPPFKIE
jgi:hypothetical protein